jgi:hypothetical protein
VCIVDPHSPEAVHAGKSQGLRRAVMTMGQPNTHSRWAIVVIALAGVLNRGRVEAQEGAAEAAGLDNGLAGHWQLSGDCRDSSGHDNHGINHAVDIGKDAREGAHFNGAAYIEIPDNGTLHFGTGEFSVALWIRPDQGVEDLGDLLAKYDPSHRRGFNLGLVSSQYRSPANRRNLHFGIDQGRVESWIDCGQCDHVGIWCLCVHKGSLYAGAFVRNNGSHTDMNPLGHVYRYDGGKRWTDLGRLGDAVNVLCLASYRGELYGGVAYAGGTAGPAGKAYRYDEETWTWVDAGRVGDGSRVDCMAVYRDKLYAGISAGRPDSIFVYRGGTRWESCAQQWGSACSLGVCCGSLLAGVGHVFRYEGATSWLDCGAPGGTANYQVWSYAAYGGRLHVGTFPSGHVYRYEGKPEWLDCGRLQTTYQDSGEKEVMALVAYNGKLYGSLWPTGEVYRYEGGSNWSYLAALGRQGHGSRIQWRRTSDKHGVGTGSVPWVSDRDDEHPPIFRSYAGAPRISRVPALAVYQGKLFAGTWNWEYDLPGHVYCMEAGRNVTHDHELAEGWRHVAAIRRADRLELYVDGEPVAQSSPFEAAQYDLSNKVPLQIGFGAGDYFKGAIRDVRLYSRALGRSEVRQLSMNSAD